MINLSASDKASGLTEICCLERLNELHRPHPYILSYIYLLLVFAMPFAPFAVVKLSRRVNTSGFSLAIRELICAAALALNVIDFINSSPADKTLSGTVIALIGILRHNEGLVPQCY